MKYKLLLAVPLVAAGAFAGASWKVGEEAEVAFGEMLKSLDDSMPFSIDRGEFANGFIESRAVTHIRNNDTEDGEVMFSLVHEIKHPATAAIGSNGVTIETRLLQDDLSDEQKEALKFFDNGEPFVLVTSANRDGAHAHDLTLNAAEFEKDGNRFSFDGGQINYVRNGDNYKSEGTLGNLEVYSGEQDTRMLMTGVKIDADIDMLGYWLYTGTSNINLGKLRISSPQLPQEVFVNNVNLSYEGSADDAHYDMIYRMSGEMQNLPVQLTGLSLEVEADNMSMPALRKMSANMKQLTEKVMENANGMDEEVIEDLAADYNGMMQDYANLMVPSTKLVYRLGATNDGGEMKTDVQVFVPDDAPADFMQSIKTVGDILRAFRFAANLDADAEAVNRTPLAAFMFNPMAQQFIVSDENSYRANLFTDKLMLNVNGQEMPLEGMIGPMLDAPIEAMVPNR